MHDLLTWAHILSGVVVLAEAMNKLERCDPLRRGITARVRTTESLKAVAWFLLAIGAGGAIISPLMLAMGAERMASGTTILLRLEYPTLAETCVLVGFAVLIVRTRVKEG